MANHMKYSHQIHALFDISHKSVLIILKATKDDLMHAIADRQIKNIIVV
jgi:hypothetical protein